MLLRVCYTRARAVDVQRARLAHIRGPSVTEALCLRSEPTSSASKAAVATLPRSPEHADAVMTAAGQIGFPPPRTPRSRSHPRCRWASYVGCRREIGADVVGRDGGSPPHASGPRTIRIADT